MERGGGFLFVDDWAGSRREMALRKAGGKEGRGILLPERTVESFSICGERGVVRGVGGGGGMASSHTCLFEGGGREETTYRTIPVFGGNEEVDAKLGPRRGRGRKNLCGLSPFAKARK